MLSAPLLAVLVLAADGASDSGSKDAGESASAWHAGGFLFWTIVVLIGAGILIAGIVLKSRSGSAAGTAATGKATGAPVPRRVEDVQAQEGWDLAVLTFDHINGAERAFADVCEHEGEGPWSHDVAFAEVHHHGRILVRGTLAGRYVDVRDLAAAEGETLVTTAVWAGVPEGSSGVIACAPVADVDQIVAAYGDRPTALSRHRVSAQEAEALTIAVAEAPAATAPDPEER